MKTKNIFNGIFFASALFASTVVITSCDKDDDDVKTTYAVSGDASGAQENPAVATSATATLSGTYNATTNKLDYTISWNGLSGAISVAHFHGPALIGVNANPISDISISANGITGTTSGSLTLADSTEAHLLNGKLYYNLHTVLNPAGEIRGQVSATSN
jgi:hypothetical protein